MTGFGLRDATNFVVSGTLDTTSKTCSKLTDYTAATLALTNPSTPTGVITNFVSSQTTGGK